MLAAEDRNGGATGGSQAGVSSDGANETLNDADCGTWSESGQRVEGNSRLCSGVSQIVRRWGGRASS